MANRDMERGGKNNRGVNHNNNNYFSEETSGGTQWTSWLIPAIVVANLVVFIAVMFVNDCPKKINGPNKACVARFLGRFSFQPLKENPLFGPSSSTFFLLFFVPSPISAGFYPNSSSIPPELRRNATDNVWNSFLNFTGCHSGMKVNGLYKIKQYFQHFGYIPETLPIKFTDDFDDILKNAVEMYQRNFRLNITGELDELTLQHVVIPRCGVPDVINGTSTMHGDGRRRTYEVSFTGRGPHFHAVKRYSFFPGQPRWPDHRRDLTYAFDPRNALTEEVKTVFARAFARWAEVTPLTFTRVESFLTSDISVGFYSGDHGDGEPFDGVMGTLAHAFSPPNGHFHLDRDENWLISNGGGDSFLSETAAVDLESVAVHEIGHLLGLGHSSVQDSIMYPTITTGRRKVDLTSDDVEGVQYLYGPNPTFNGSIPPPPSTQQRDTGDSGDAACKIDGSRSVVTSLLMISTVGLFLLYLL